MTVERRAIRGCSFVSYLLTPSVSHKTEICFLKNLE